MAQKYLLFFFVFVTLPTFVWAQEERGPKTEKAIPKIANGQTWALIVGVAEYQYINSLRFADDDALAFYNYLLSPAGGSVPLSNVQLLTNDKASLGQLDRALGNLLDLVKPNDKVFIYFSGHGDQESRTIAQRGFLLTHDAFSSNYNSTAFPVLYLQDYIATLATKNQAQVIMFLDACHAGKLAGSEIGGVQLTGTQLLKQVANEVKFLACQTTEVSLEGYQWGGGRGLFSYHLVRGLQGLADVNQDKKITLLELGRYLEDHVTPEAAPSRQNPVLLAGDKSLVVAQVNDLTLAALKKNVPIPAFTAVKGKGIEENILNVADPKVRQWYRLFQNAIVQKRLLDATNAAEWHYDSLMTSTSIKEFLPFIQRDFVAALLEESSKVFGEVLENNSQIKSKIGYQKSIRYLEKASEILGESNIRYGNLRAQAFYYKGLLAEISDKTEAFANYQQAVLADSTFAPAYNDLGRMLYLKKAYSEAIPIFEKGIKYAPTWSFLHLNYGLALANQNRLAEAEVAYKKAIDLKPEEPTAYKNYGNLLTKLKRVNEAETAYKKAIELNANDADVYNNYGLLLSDQKRFRDAELAYRKSLNIQPNDAQVLSNYAIILFDQNRYAEAENALKKSIQINPADEIAHYNYGYLLSAQNRGDEAEEAFKKAIELNPKYAPAYHRYGVLLASQNRFEEAESNYKQYIELMPTDADVYGNFANLLTRQKRLKEAESNYRKSIELNPNDANVFKNFAYLLKIQNRLAEAEIVYQRAIQLKSTDSDVYRSYGLLLYDRDRLEEAEIAYKKAIELNPDDAEVYNSYGRLLNAKSRWSEAETAYKKSLELNPNIAIVHGNYANLLANQNRPQEAEKEYITALKLKPNDVNINNNLGNLLEQQGRLTEAETSYKKAFESNQNSFMACYFIACLKARQNIATEAIEWLDKAFSKGFADFNRISRSHDFDNMRETDDFKALLNKYKKL